MSFLPDTLPNEAYKWRTLKYGVQGWDTYALQTGLVATGNLHVSDVDGDFGTYTEQAVKVFQQNKALVDDGIAGPATQFAVAKAVFRPVQRQYALPKNLIRGQLNAESSFWLGNYSSTYSNGRKDMGVAQRNGVVDVETMKNYFDVGQSITKLAQNLRGKFEEYYGKPGAKTFQRAWELAAGSWNAPAWTDKLASGGTLTQAQSDHIEGYIDRVTQFVNWDKVK